MTSICRCSARARLLRRQAQVDGLVGVVGNDSADHRDAALYLVDKNLIKALHLGATQACSFPGAPSRANRRDTAVQMKIGFGAQSLLINMTFTVKGSYYRGDNTS
jgi:hypothetical protein